MSSDSSQTRIDHDEIRRRVEKYYNQRKEWLIHLSIFVVINAVLWGLWLGTQGLLGVAFPWPLVVMLGWGAGLAGHGVEVAAHSPDRLARVDRTVHQQMDAVYGPDWASAADDEDYQRIYRAAHKRYRQKAEFIIHLAVFVVVNLLMWLMWLSIDVAFPFPLIVLGGWGAGLVGHAATMYFDSSRAAEARERAVQEAISRYNAAYDVPRKRKRREHLLTDDGELLDIVEETEAEQEGRLRGA